MADQGLVNSAVHNDLLAVTLTSDNSVNTSIFYLGNFAGIPTNLSTDGVDSLVTQIVVSQPILLFTWGS